MSRRGHQAPFAVASDGTVFVNAVEFDVPPDSLEKAMAWALRQEGRIFIGVALTSTEQTEVLARLRHGFTEAAGHLVGGVHLLLQPRRVAGRRAPSSTCSEVQGLLAQRATPTDGARALQAMNCVDWRAEGGNVTRMLAQSMASSAHRPDTYGARHPGP